MLFQLKKAQINCKINNYSKTQMKTIAATQVQGVKNLASGLHGNRAVGLITVSTLCEIRRFSTEHHSLSR